VSFAAVKLYVAFQLVFIGVSLYFVIDSVRKLLVTPYSSLHYFRARVKKLMMMSRKLFKTDCALEYHHIWT
jgi:hypothetical protein